MSDYIHKEINFKEILSIETIPHFKNLVNLFPNLISISVFFNDNVILCKQNKKDNIYIEELTINDKPNHYDIQQYNIESIHATNILTLHTKTNHNFINTHILNFNTIINNVGTLQLNNNIEFINTIEYYKKLFSYMNIDYKLINAINDNKEIYLCSDVHDEKHTKPNNLPELKNDNTFIITKEPVNFVLFNHFYKNYSIIYKIVRHIYYFLIDCKQNNIMPYFINEPNIEHIFNTNDIYYTKINKYGIKIYGIKIINYDIMLCIKKNDKLNQPSFIELIFNTSKQKYRLQCSTINFNIDGHKYKLSLIKKQQIDDAKQVIINRQNKQKKIKSIV